MRSARLAPWHDHLGRSGDGEPELERGNNTLTGTSPRGELFTIQVTNTTTGAYNFTLKDNVLHANGADENEATINLGYTVKDSEGDSANGTFSIQIDDDSPNATPQSGEAEAQPRMNTNLLLIDDFGPWSTAAAARRWRTSTSWRRWKASVNELLEQDPTSARSGSASSGSIARPVHRPTAAARSG